MYGYILLPAVLFRNYPKIINQSFTISPGSKISFTIPCVNHSGMNAEPFHKFLQSQIKLPEFPLVRPFQWQKLFVTMSFLGAVGLVAKLAWPQVKTIVSNKNTWAVVSLVYLIRKFAKSRLRS